jgi:hypothetical protein
VAVTDVVMPRPVVPWTTVVQADDPTRAATLGRLRELRKKHRVTAGVTVPRRGERRLEGRATYYSVLSVLAARCRQEGHEEAAAEMVQAAEKVEGDFSGRLKTFLRDHTLADLPAAEFFDDLATATAECVAAWSRRAPDLLAVARVNDMADVLARLEGTSPSGEPVAVDLPRALLDRQSLTTGDLVWVFSRSVGDAAMVELLPAMCVAVEAKSAGDTFHALAKFVKPPLVSPLSGAGSDGMTDEERKAFADRFNATVGANLSGEDVARLQGYVVAGRLPRRRLRPAG